MTKKMAEAGADAVLVVTPSYYKSQMNSEALEQHYTKVHVIFAITRNTGFNSCIDIEKELRTATLRLVSDYLYLAKDLFASFIPLQINRFCSLGAQ